MAHRRPPSYYPGPYAGPTPAAPIEEVAHRARAEGYPGTVGHEDAVLRYITGTDADRRHLEAHAGEHVTRDRVDAVLARELLVPGQEAREAERVYEEARAHRDGMVVWAIRCGLTRDEAARAADVSRPTVDNVIRRADRQEGGR